MTVVFSTTVNTDVSVMTSLGDGSISTHGSQCFMSFPFRGKMTHHLTSDFKNVENIGKCVAWFLEK